MDFNHRNVCLQRPLFIALIGALAFLTTVQTFYLIQLFCRRNDESDDFNSEIFETTKSQRLRELREQRTQSIPSINDLKSLETEPITDYESSIPSLPTSNTTSMETLKS